MRRVQKFAIAMLSAIKERFALVDSANSQSELENSAKQTRSVAIHSDAKCSRVLDRSIRARVPEKV
jgi:hypothetical protein